MPPLLSEHDEEGLDCAVDCMIPMIVDPSWTSESTHQLVGSPSAPPEHSTANATWKPWTIPRMVHRI